MVCTGRRVCYQVGLPPKFEGRLFPAIPRECPCNEMTALTHRLIGKTRDLSERGFRLFDNKRKRLTKALLKRFGVLDAWSYQTVLNGYSGSMKARYEMAYDKIRNGLLVGKMEARISAFTKAERFDVSKLEWKAPRLIEARRPEFNLEIARFLKPIEKVVYQHAIKGPDGVVTRVFAGGMTATERAKAIRKKLGCFKDGVAISVDFSRFDMHTNIRQLRSVDGLYLALLGNSDFQRLLSYKHVNKGYTATGISFTSTGARMSGDMDTLLGNSIVCYCMVASCAEYLLGNKYNLLVQGDDAIVFMESKQAHVFMERASDIFAEMGHKAVFEGGLVSDARRIRFCQASMVQSDGEYRMVRDPLKCVSNFGSSHKHFHNMKGGLAVLKSCALCELACNPGVPIVQQMCVSWLEKLRYVREARLAASDEYLYRVKATTGSPSYSDAKAKRVTAKARSDFAVAFGISVEEQLKLERAIDVTVRNIDIDSGFVRTGEPILCSANMHVEHCHAAGIVPDTVNVRFG